MARTDVVLRRTQMVFAALALLAVVSSPARAQITTATVTGSVRDTSGGVIPGATVTLVSASRGTSIETVTMVDGSFVFPTVPTDTYTARVVLTGLKTLDRPNLVVSPGDRLALGTLTIDVGTVEETITVAG